MNAASVDYPIAARLGGEWHNILCLGEEHVVWRAAIETKEQLSPRRIVEVVVL
jgi:hypothetical protein